MKNKFEIRRQPKKKVIRKSDTVEHLIAKTTNEVSNFFFNQLKKLLEGIFFDIYFDMYI